MPLSVEREPDDMMPWNWPLERCCICGERTPYWLLIDGKVTGESPALCPSCAASNETRPTKREWIDGHRARHA